MRGMAFSKASNTEEYWHEYKNMMERTGPYLRSLSLSSGRYEEIRDVGDNTVCHPLLIFSRYQNLRSLELQGWFKFPTQDWDAFWILCRRLETLKLDYFLSMDMVSTIPDNTDDHASDPQQQSSTSTSESVLFPRLRELVIIGDQKPESEQVLNLIIRQCPMLRTLTWSLHMSFPFPMRLFTELFEASTWPELDDITIKHQKNGQIHEDDYRRVVQAFKRPMRRLNIKPNPIQLIPTLSLIMANHFSTLVAIDLTHGIQDPSHWTLKVLTSCPRLRSLESTIIHAQDMLDEYTPWACHGLEKFVVAFNMGFADRSPDRKWTSEDLDKCRRVYERLAEFKQLRVLDLLTGYLGACERIRTSPVDFTQAPVPLPFRLDAGLDLLKSCTGLEKIRFWSGTEAMHEDKLRWIVGQWEQLRILRGGSAWRITHDTVTKCVNGHRIRTMRLDFDGYQRVQWNILR